MSDTGEDVTHGACGWCDHDPACGFASTWSEATGEVWWCHDDDHSCYAIDALAAAMNMDDPEPVVVLDTELSPTGVLVPCGSRMAGPFLGSDATWVACAGLDGHDGRHLFHVEWGASAIGYERVETVLTERAGTSDPDGHPGRERQSP